MHTRVEYFHLQCHWWLLTQLNQYPCDKESTKELEEVLEAILTKVLETFNRVTSLHLE